MIRLLALGSLCLLAWPRAAAAEVHLTPLVGLTFAGNTSLLDLELATDKVHGNFGGAVGVFGRGVFGAEGLVVYTRGFFNGDGDLIKSSRSLVVMGNAVLTAPQRWTEYFVRPFVSVGVGLLQASYDETTPNILPVSVRMTGFNVGGGLIGFVSARTGVRLDLRYYGNLSREGTALTTENVHLRYMTASIGVVFRR